MNKITSFDQIGGKADQLNPLLELVNSLAQLHPLEYDQKRKEIAKEHNIRISTLDELVTKARQALEEGEKTDEQFKEWAVAPWSEPVDGRQLLDRALEILQRYVIADIESLWAAAAWAALTWLTDHATVLPMAMITAPEKGCGKSVLLDVLAAMVCRPLQGGSITQSATFRSIELWKPTLLIDEADSFMKENEAMRGLLNSGHTRGSAYKILSEEIGGKLQPVKFSTWGAKAIAGIKLETLDSTLTSRSIVLPMRRKKPAEQTESFRHADQGPFKEIQSMFYRWALDNGQEFSRLRPIMPELSNRDADNWEPLLAIADLAAGDWPDRMRSAARKIVCKKEETPSVDAELLNDIREIFERLHAERLPTAKLMEELIKDDLGRWATYNRGNAMHPRQLAGRLAAYGIRSKTIRFGVSTSKGYELSDFSDVFERYIPDSIGGGVLSETPKQTAIDAGCSNFLSETKHNAVVDKNDRSEALTANCYGVADKIGGSGEDIQIVEEFI
ncbi:MAG: hypothetical protein GQF41_1061 [Candidatus Rifleibacterium amylolyticum]|nr:MAG: hypothetical protein GQF41_1061 [Candidatus Rifleibacterium amylolyticum]